MILIITHKSDFTADYVINKLNQRGINYKRFNCEDILSNKVTLNYNSKFSYSILGETDFQSVWFRRTKLPEIQELSFNDKLYILNEIDTVIKNLFAVIESNWLSEPFYVYKAENKLLQLKTAQKIGFKIPPTLITTIKENLRDFFYQNKESIIIKPLSQTRVGIEKSQSFLFTNIITKGQIDNLDEYDLTPCIYQKNIEKEYELRVTVVKDKVFAAAVDSQDFEETKLDWRRERLAFRKVDLPSEIERLCINIVKELNLKFGAIDLIKTKNNEYYFLEVNPNGQWVWIETQTGLEISESIIAELIS
jgi:glutathione synthase/RimK-type ligase-like ATP-grasp enzyme